MANIYVLMGLPGCGKSTHAKKLIDVDPDRYVRSNKDEIRALLHNSHWSKGREKQVMRIEDAIIEDALTYGKDVLCDNTHGWSGHLKRFREIADKYPGTEVHVLFFATPYEECLRRDRGRVGKAQVGKHVIDRMWNNEFQALYDKWKTFDDGASFREHFTSNGVDSVEVILPQEEEAFEPVYVDDPSLPEAVVFDIDGTVARMVNRGPFDWLKVHEDEPHWDVIEFVRMAKASGRTVIAVSGRDGVCRELTENWLKAHEVPYDHLYMRVANDSRKDYVIKEEIYRENIIGKYRILSVLDDRQQVVDHLRGLGLRVFQVAPGSF